MSCVSPHDVLQPDAAAQRCEPDRERPALLDALKASGVDPEAEGLIAFGAAWGSAERLDLGRLANENHRGCARTIPEAYRIDAVEFHPAYPCSCGRAWRTGSMPRPGTSPEASHAHVARAARIYTAASVESGHICPITMTHASVAALAASPSRLAEWLPKIRSRDYDSRFIPFWEKTAVTLGMGMTEKQGGTDVGPTPPEPFQRQG